jgi:hypothetical protein
LRRRHNAEVAAGLTPSTLALAAASDVDDGPPPPPMTTFRSSSGQQRQISTDNRSSSAKPQPPSPLDHFLGNKFQVNMKAIVHSLPSLFLSFFSRHIIVSYADFEMSFAESFGSAGDNNRNDESRQKKNRDYSGEERTFKRRKRKKAH